MKYSSRFWLYAPLCLFLGIAAWAVSHWWAAADAMDKKLTALNGHEAIPGVTISYASKTISGFPFRVDVVFTNLRLAGAGAHGPFVWTTEHFAMHGLTYGRAQEIFEAAGQQSLSWTDTGGQPHHLNFLPGSLRASSIADARGLARFDLDIIAAGGADTDGKRFTVGRAQLHLRRDPKNADALDLMASADQANDNGGIASFGPHIRLLRSYVTLNNAGALMPLLQGEATWPAAVSAWHGVAVPGTQQINLAGATASDAQRSAASDIMSPLY